MSWLRGVVALMLLATSAVVARAPEITGFEVNGSHGKLRIFIVSTSPVEYEVDESSNAMSLDVEVYPAVLGASARRVPGVPNELVRSATVRDLGGNRVRLSLRFAQPLRYEISPTGQG
ncbi:MAG: hypothetical protein FJX76_09020, partial [Armatimonadetes bacterium]|nr:hypothetical protein [Armatimonadota bacterium]